MHLNEKSLTISNKQVHIKYTLTNCRPTEFLLKSGQRPTGLMQSTSDQALNMYRSTLITDKTTDTNALLNVHYTVFSVTNINQCKLELGFPVMTLRAGTTSKNSMKTLPMTQSIVWISRRLNLTWVTGWDDRTDKGPNTNILLSRYE